jgi:hypothetical protein
MSGLTIVGYVVPWVKSCSYHEIGNLHSGAAPKINARAKPGVMSIALIAGIYGIGVQPAPLFQLANTFARVFTPLRSTPVAE